MAVQTKAIQRQELSLVAVPPTPISSQKPKAAPPSLPTPLAVQCATAKAAAVPKGNNPPGATKTAVLRFLMFPVLILRQARQVLQ